MGFMPRNIAITGNTFERCSRCLPDPFHAGSAASLPELELGARLIHANGLCWFRFPQIACPHPHPHPRAK